MARVAFFVWSLFSQGGALGALPDINAVMFGLESKRKTILRQN
jgi:hypothetical protein